MNISASFNFQDIRQDAHLILQAGLQAVEPANLIQKAIEKLKLERGPVFQSFFESTDQEIILVGAGKAVTAMTRGLLAAMEQRVIRGNTIGSSQAQAPLSTIEYTVGGHPVPDESSLRASQRLISFIENTAASTGIVNLLSGGASSLLSIPEKPLTLADLQQLYQVLIHCGATIDEINCLRKHCSVLAGGGLAKVARPRKVLSFIISDVVGDPLDVIGSGPTAPDESSFIDAMNIVTHYKLEHKIPATVFNLVQAGCNGEIPETPGVNDPIFEKVTNIIVGNNHMALEKMAWKAQQLGYEPLILSDLRAGTVHDLAHKHMAIIFQDEPTESQIPPPIAYISGGEGTVNVTGSGKGGRNQEFVLESITAIAGHPIVVASMGSDGIDGNTAAAGAIADGWSLTRARKKALDHHEYLHHNDSFHFFEALHDLIITGPTGTNVMDLRLILTRKDVP
ncbi:glycerate kinase [candidate division CSSED10-310 bacterium]|uniref:Glycerate kinase n=1 Tax=candidate division CSSED10-310 bacterium TaxID=2855610 RepID=A0ABV6YV48_UNCC1